MVFIILVVGRAVQSKKARAALPACWLRCLRHHLKEVFYILTAKMTFIHQFLAVTSAPLMISSAVVAAVCVVDAVAYLTPAVYVGIIVLVAWGIDFWRFKQYQAHRPTVKGAVLITGASSGIINFPYH